MSIFEYEQRLALRRANLRRGLPDIDPGPPPPGLRPARLPPSLQPMLESNKENLPPDRLATMEAQNVGADQMARANRLEVPSGYIPLPETSTRLVELSRYGRGGGSDHGGGRVALGEILPAADGGRGVSRLVEPAQAGVEPGRLLRRGQGSRRNSMPMTIANAFPAVDVGDMENVLPQPGSGLPQNETPSMYDVLSWLPPPPLLFSFTLED